MDSTEASYRNAAEILALFTHDNLIHDRKAALRAMIEAVRVWPGSIGDEWEKWIAEASASLGLSTKTLDCSVDEAFELVRDGARLIAYREVENSQNEDSDEAGEWLAVVAASPGRYQVLSTGAADSSKPISAHAFKKRLALCSDKGQIRCVVILPQNLIASSAGGDGEVLSPLKRLWMLLVPEARDIWVVAIFGFVVSALMLATPIAVEALVNTVAFGRFLQPIFVLSAILLTFLGFQAAIRALQAHVVEIIQQRLFARVAGDLSYRLPRASIESVDGENVPELVNRFFDIVTVQKVVPQLLIDGLGLILSTLIGLGVLAFYHPWLLGFDLFLLAAIALIVFVIGRGAVGTAIKESKQKYYMASWLEEIGRCPTTFRIDGGAEFAMERSDRLIHDYLTARRKHFRIVMRQIMFSLGLQAVASTILLGLGGWLVISGELTLGQLVAAELIVTVIVGSFAKIGKHLESFYDLLASIDKLGTLFDIKTERRDGMLGTDRTSAVQLALDSVSYTFPNGCTALHGISADVASGERLAIVGGSGAGKSTLLDLIYGLRSPTSGSMTVDGFDPRDLRPDILRGRVTLARGSEVLHATVEENIHLHSDEIMMGKIRKVLNGVGLLPAILRLSEGMGTMLTSSGLPLSKTQCRLLAVARAAVRQPGLLLIDGVLDGLADEELDHVLTYLLDPQEPWTLIIATSRPEIANRCNRTINL